MQFTESLKKELETIPDYSNLFYIKGNKSFFLEDINAISSGNTDKLFKEIKMHYELLMESLTYYNLIKGMPQDKFCNKYLKISERLDYSFKIFISSEYFQKEENDNYFLRISRFSRNQMRWFTLECFIKNVSKTAMILHELVEMGNREELSEFNSLIDDIIKKLLSHAQIFSIIMELKDNAKLSELRHRQIIAKNGVPVEIIENITWFGGTFNVLCVGGVCSIKEMEEEGKRLYKFIGKQRSFLLPDEMPIGKYATLIYEIRKGNAIIHLLNEIESDLRENDTYWEGDVTQYSGYKDNKRLYDFMAERAREKNIYKKILPGIKAKIKDNESVGYILQTEVAKGYERKGYAKALIDVALALFSMQYNCKVAYCKIMSDNPDHLNAIKLSEKEGFYFFKYMQSHEKTEYRSEQVSYHLGIRFVDNKRY